MLTMKSQLSKRRYADSSGCHKYCNTHAGCREPWGQLVADVQVRSDHVFRVSVIAPRAVVVAMETQDRPERTVGCPSQKNPSHEVPHVAATVGMHVRFKVMHS